jgi:hypothetical protein
MNEQIFEIIVILFAVLIPMLLIWVSHFSYSSGYDEGFAFCKWLCRDYKDKTGKELYDLKDIENKGK